LDEALLFWNQALTVFVSLGGKTTSQQGVDMKKKKKDDKNIHPKTFCKGRSLLKWWMLVELEKLV
jgi:hypothetical protein